MYQGGSSNQFSIRLLFEHGGCNEKLFFEKFGVYTTELNISDNLWNLKDDLRKLKMEKLEWLS
ncbi:MAG: hypothetical protein MRERC_3c110 [Mycoplasmataceae bacterium RC_NB112A]|nr:MAG: hypothetical protein MRERC_12c052 [Mycoplasmataceae bacterium RC_NB112A]KLL02257.1 MAG: hypothetical protein MRERC_3c110 [Mycoplasmataceae bacterium RC_NB112A]